MSLKKMIADCLNGNLARIRMELGDNLRRWRNSGRGRSKGRIIMFGASTMCEICIRHLEQCGIMVDIICDNNSNRHGEFVTDNGRRIKIVSVEEAMGDESGKLCFVAAGAQHFEAISSQLGHYTIMETVMKWSLDFYLETVRLLCVQSIPFMDRIEELLNFYEDEESLKIIWAHFAMLFDLKNIPDVLKAVSMEKLCIPSQYFLENGKYLGKQDIMVDCGAYTGDTLEDLVYRVKYDAFLQYDCYEVFPLTYGELGKTVDKLPTGIQKKVRTYCAGVGEKDTIGRAVADGSGYNSSIQGNGDTAIRIVRLDDIYEKSNVSFLKMDIEGSEQAALRGGKNMIAGCRPMCAISVYHSIAAFWEVPRLLREYVPEYKMILRHHTARWDDTVCYAKTGEW